MLSNNRRSTARLALSVLLVAGSLLSPVATVAQTLPSVRATFVARDAGTPNPCNEFACFDHASYDGNTLGAVGLDYPALYIYARIPAGPWYRQAIVQNRSGLRPGYTSAGYRSPVVVVGDDIFVTAYQNGPGLPTLCETRVYGRTGTVWGVKQIINACASRFAKDGYRVLLFSGSGDIPILSRGVNGQYTEESRIVPPTPVFFNGPTSMALYGWTAIFGTPLANGGAGAAYIYQRNAGQWTLWKTITPDVELAGSQFGTAVAAGEFEIAIGAPLALNDGSNNNGRVYIYSGIGENWFARQALIEPLPTGNRFGSALAMRGRRLVISTDNGYSYAGGPFTYLYERGALEPNWLPRASLAAGQGFSVSLSGSTAFIDQKGLRLGSYPTIVNLPALREADRPQ